MLELGKYSSDFLYGLRSGANSLFGDNVDYSGQKSGFHPFNYSIDRTEFGVFALWFFGENTAILNFGLSQGTLKMDGTIYQKGGSGTETFVFTADMKATFLTIGIGNQWITDHGSVWQFEWLLWKPVLSSSKSYTVLSNSFSNPAVLKFENEFDKTV